MMRLTFSVLLVMGAAFVTCSCGQAPAATGEGSSSGVRVIEMPSDSVAAVLSSLFAGTRMEADGLNAGSGTSIPTRISFSLGAALGDKSASLDVAPKVLSLGYAGQVVYRLGHIRLDSCRVDPVPGGFLVKATLSSKGPTLKGYHDYLGDVAVPDVELTDMRLEVRLKPSAVEGKPSFKDPQATFYAKAKAPMAKVSLNGQETDVLETLTGYQKTIRSLVEQEVVRVLSDPKVQASAAEFVWQEGSAFAQKMGSRLVQAEFEGTTLRLKVQ